MKKEEKIYDKNGTLLNNRDVIDTDGCTLEIHYDEWYICGKKDMWRIEEFTIECYKDGYLLTDFEKSQG
jgi:hypothetical protein